SDFLEYKDSFYKIHFKALLYNNKLFIRIQNPKHAKKTARNQIFSGARLLSLGISTVRYDQLFKLAHQLQHFLLKCDVLNVDKQDDGTALHTFHSNNLSQILVN
ncbi:12337_t:CDS:1, partial [Gigaspora rosea]